MIGEMKDGKYHGKIQFLNPDGTIKREGKFENGERIE